MYMTATRVTLHGDPYADRPENSFWATRGIWPCAWISCPGTPVVAAYRRAFVLDAPAQFRIHVSADERYDLFLDGERIGRGSERGAPDLWFFETYDLDLAAGPHTLVARVWALGAAAPGAQMSVYPGFLCASQAEPLIGLLGTGVAEWQAKPLGGYQLADIAIPGHYFAVGANLAIDGSQFDWGFERGQGAGWQPAVVRDPGANAHTRVEFAPLHLLAPASLPPMIEREQPAGQVRFVGRGAVDPAHPNAIRPADQRADDLADWNALLHRRQPVEIPTHSTRQVLIDLENYYCAYPALVVSGGAGASVRLAWAESLFREPAGHTKGNRGEIDGKFFVGLADTFMPDGGARRTFETLWWRCGRYVELTATTADAPLVIEGLRLRETRYPLEIESHFAASDARLEEVVPIAVRALQMCSHETYMDCPYYEQLMYVGDTRLEALATYAITRDDRLPRKALRIFGASRLPTGLTQSRFPSRVRQIIPPFALWWVAMLHDYALWRGDAAFVRELMPGARGVLDYFGGLIGADGLVAAPRGWNFTDWVPAWNSGVPPTGELGTSGIINWQYALVLGLAARVEEWLGENELAARARRRASELAARIDASFWDTQHGCYADDLAKQHFSEHAQCLAILSGQLSAARQQQVTRALIERPDLERTTIYFTHYLFETYTLLGRPDKLLERLQVWFDLKSNGFKTTFEMPEPSRSDCHAWGAHPLYHYFASLLGIRPASFGFGSVAIAPQLGGLTSLAGTLVHPRGEIRVELRAENDRVHAQIALPEGVSGTLFFDAGDTSAAAREDPAKAYQIANGETVTVEYPAAQS
jgi:hypothetical protein